MQRLLSINNYHYRRGGADIVYLEHGALFERLGWQTAYFSMQHPKNLPSPWSEYFVEEIELGGDYTLPMKVAKSVKAIYSFEAQRKLRLLLSRFEPSIAHLHNIYHHISPSILPVLSQAGVPVVLTAHDLKIACPNYRMLSGQDVCQRCKGGNYLNVVLQRCVHGSLTASSIVAVEATVHSLLRSYRKHVDRIVVPSRFFVQKFVEWGWDEKRFIHIPNYVDAEAFEPQFQPGRYFLYFGRLSFEKGVATLISAAARAGVPLKIAGTGPDADSLKAQAAKLGAEVEFLGYRTGQDLHDLVRGCRAMVLPSEWFENAPLSVLESFAMGKPVIGARIGGIPELIREDATGWLFDSGSVEALADALRRVQSLPDVELARFGRNAREDVARNFSKNAYVSAVSSLYAELQSRRALPRAVSA
ncbi:MAG: glycosyltransferase family 4 protein [Lautropia sp.]